MLLENDSPAGANKKSDCLDNMSTFFKLLQSMMYNSQKPGIVVLDLNTRTAELNTT